MSVLAVKLKFPQSRLSFLGDGHPNLGHDLDISNRPSQPDDVTIDRSRPATPCTLEHEFSGLTSAVSPGEPIDKALPSDDAACQLRAIAQYAYTPSPDDSHELSFSEDEILDILRPHGKWWQARKADGTMGSVSSNYFYLLPGIGTSIGVTVTQILLLDRTAHSAIPVHILSQPAPDPPIPSTSRLILRSHKFPWPVVVGPSNRCQSSSTNSVTNLDVLHAVHAALLMPMTPVEWESLGRGSRAQQEVTKAHEKRCTRMGGDSEDGIRRIDWLGSKTTLVGVKIDKSVGQGGIGKLVFGKA